MTGQTQILKDLRLPKALIGELAGFDGAAEGEFLRGDVHLRDGRVCGMSAGEPSAAGGRILLPKLVDPHCHLDKCHTVDRIPDVGGDLGAAIAAQHADKDRWTEADIRTRVSRGIAEYAASGTGLIRSHVDWGDGAEPPLSWSVMCELAQDETAVTVQLSPLTGADSMADKSFADCVSSVIPDRHALGVFVLNQPGFEEGVRNAFAVAQSRGLPLDFHVDEGLDRELNGLEVIADIALETGNDVPVLCGHAVSLSQRSQLGQRRIIDKLARANISVAMLPSTNLYLQGRRQGTPLDRGVTLIRELAESGVRVVVGNDNVRDAFCPVGRHDPLRVLELAVMTAHLDPPFGRWLGMISTHAAEAMGATPTYLNGAAVDQLMVADASDFSTLICGAPLAPASTYLENE